MYSSRPRKIFSLNLPLIQLPHSLLWNVEIWEPCWRNNSLLVSSYHEPQLDGNLHRYREQCQVQSIKRAIFGEGLFLLLFKPYSKKPSAPRLIVDLLTDMTQWNKAHLTTQRIFKTLLLTWNVFFINVLQSCLFFLLSFYFIIILLWYN